MPNDARFGRDLATRLSAKFTGRIPSVQFTYDGYFELDRLGESEPYCVIAPNLYQQIRETRAHWRESIQLSLVLVSKVGPTDDETWIDEWLDSWDTLIRFTREEPVFGKHKPQQVEMDERYDTDAFHNHHRLITQAVLYYGNVEVI